jgi:mono/diheme cytochrome c family protein
MSSRFGWFVLGALAAFAALFVGGYLFIASCGVSMETTAPLLPMEATVAKMALRASIGNAAEVKNPLSYNDSNMQAGAQEFKEHCAFCHGLPGQPRPDAAAGMFPVPPQLFEAKEMVTDDPEGITHWKVTHGIRLSGMPGFEKTLSDTKRWQVTMLVAHADKLSSAVRAALGH